MWPVPSVRNIRYCLRVPSVVELRVGPATHTRNLFPGVLTNMTWASVLPGLTRPTWLPRVRRVGNKNISIPSP